MQIDNACGQLFGLDQECQILEAWLLSIIPYTLDLQIASTIAYTLELGLSGYLTN